MPAILLYDSINVAPASTVNGTKAKESAAKRKSAGGADHSEHALNDLIEFVRSYAQLMLFDYHRKYYFFAVVTVVQEVGRARRR